MAAAVAQFDWAATPLGPMDQWPQSFRTAVSICLNSRFPMFVWWGDELINIYNDSYVSVLGKRHPEALGQPAKSVWSELWPVIGDEVATVMRGEAVSRVRERFVLERNGYPEETFFTYSHSPIPDDNGGVGGLFQVCYDETLTVQAERALQQRVNEAQAFSMTVAQQAELFNTALTHMHDHAYLLDCNSRFLYANRPLLKLWGLTMSEVTGKRFSDLPYPAEMAAALHEQVQQVVKTRHAVVDETPYTGVDGKTAHYEYVFSPIFDAYGEVEVVTGTSRDITLRKRAELEREQMLQELDAERKNLRAIIEEAPAFIAVLRGPHHQFELANDRYCKLVDNRDIIGKTVLEALPEVEGQGFLSLLDQVFQTGQTYVGSETPVDLNYGGELAQHFVDFIYHALRNPDGSVSGIFVHGIDVTESVLARTVIERSERQRGLALDAADLGSWHIDASSLTLTTDARFRQIFGVRQTTVSYEEAFAAIHPEDRDRVRVAVEKSLDPSDPIPYSAEYRIALPDGGVRWVSGQGKSNVGSDRQLLLSVDGTVADITDRKAAEAEHEQLLGAERSARAEAEQAGRIKDEFLATLSHEIRTPLNAIMGWSHIMRHSGKPEDITRGIEVIERNARAQSDIIEDLLSMSSIISGKVRLDLQRLNLANIVENAVQAARPTAEAKQIRLESVIDPMRGVEVSVDANRMQQVLWNLLTNAIKFTPSQGQIRVLLERVNSHAEISVIDTGEGIDAAFLPQVFGRFRQADAGTTRRHGGLGLGLSIVRQLVELHGGTVRAESAGVGQGSTFVVTLPLIAIQDTSEAVIDRRHPRVSRPRENYAGMVGDLNGIHVLVIDDEPDARALVQRVLEDGGARVTAAESVDETVRLVQQQKFDVLVSDIGMPGEDGYSLIRRVRQLGAAANGNIPAIALTAYARAEDRVKAVAAGFQMHIAKPVEPIELLTMVASAAGRTNLGEADD